MQLHQIKTYSIEEHPDQEAVYDWIRNHWHDLGEFIIEESIDSLKAFSDYMDTDLDYSVCIFPDRGEYITLKVNNEDIANLSGNRLRTYLVNNYPKLQEDCPFTGVCFDMTLIDVFTQFIRKPDSRTFQDLLNDAGDALLSCIHADGEYLYSDEGLLELCEANTYQFTEDGSIYA